MIDRRGREEPEAEESESAASEAAAEAPAPEAGQPAGPPQIDFSMLILSLSHSAFYHLGLVEDPVSNETGPVNKAQARGDIDLLEILQEKTRGNLTPDEEKLLSSLLYDLHLRFVETGGSRRG
ncbi:MAG: DUF1844 domain-containing protein [Myxococcota bacterium]